MASAKEMRLRRQQRGRLVADINVAPFVDVMLVLVIILMITAPLLTFGVPVDLPQAKVKEITDTTEPLIVTVDKEGHLFLQEAATEIEALVPRLVALSGANPNLRIYLRGDRALQYGRVMEVMSLVTEAGFTRVALITETPRVHAAPNR
ncbi:MAG: biopolymer transporter ExbD [Alphaproteobacteria bacterium]|nr:biopolymer transporter ExbD [Alphaproteobacteria bacterium]